MKELELFGHKIVADKYLHMFTDYQKLYEKGANGMLESFDELLENCRNIHEIMDMSESFYQAEIVTLCDLAITGLTAKEIYDLDNEIKHFVSK